MANGQTGDWKTPRVYELFFIDTKLLKGKKKDSNLEPWDGLMTIGEKGSPEELEFGRRNLKEVTTAMLLREALERGK